MVRARATGFLNLLEEEEAAKARTQPSSWWDYGGQTKSEQGLL